MSPPPALAAPFYVPLLRNANFQGRDEDLARRRIAGQGGDMPVGIRPAGLTGMDGTAGERSRPPLTAR